MPSALEQVPHLLDWAKTIANGANELQNHMPSTVYPKSRESLHGAYLTWYDQAKTVVGNLLTPRLEQHYLDRNGEPRIERFWSDPVGLRVKGVTGTFEEDPNEQTWIYPAGQTFQRHFLAQQNVLRLHLWRHRRGFLEEVWATHVSLVDHRLRRAISNVAKGSLTIAVINDLFLSAGAQEEWWIEPLRTNSSERVAQVLGWIEGVGLWAPDRELEIVMDAAKEILSNLPQGDDNRAALETALERTCRNASQVNQVYPAVGPHSWSDKLGPTALSSDELKAAWSMLHPAVKAVTSQLFPQGHYNMAIFKACLELNAAVQQKSGQIHLDGTPLMQTAFSPKAPVLTVSQHPDEQLGFMWLFSGMTMAFRNPRAHKVGAEPTPEEALEMLAFISSLFRVLDAST